TVVAYDNASGFGLVRTLAPLGITPIELGNSGALAATESAIFAAAGGIDAASSTTVVSRRRFAGYWEYMIDDAIFTTPPRFDHSGAALIDRNGALVGVGSLIVADAMASQRRQPGNMFVPINLLKPILAEMIETGSSRRGKRPWLGITSQEVEGRVFISKVQDDSPAERAGLKQGDILLSVGSTRITKLEEFYGSLWKDTAPGDEISLTVLQGTEVRKISVQSIDRAKYIRAKSSI
ncbi:MAG: S1C family serine protease, partial [Betaproteobacteria bacterium]